MTNLNIQKLAKNYIYWPEIQNPYQKNIDFSKVKIKELAKIEKEILDRKTTKLEFDIIKFYSLNHYLGEYRKNNNQILDKNGIAVYKAYLNEIETQSKKILSYLFTSCLTEALYDERLKDNDSDDYDDDEYNGRKKKEWKIPAPYLKIVPKEKVSEFKKFFKFILDNNDSFDHYNRVALSKKILNKIEQNPDIANISIGNMFFYIDVIFKKGDFEDGFAGKSWMAICNHAYKFITGGINAEVFIDQAYSLEHNNGSVFNKEHIYSYDDTDFEIDHYSHNLDNPRVFLNMQHLGELLNFLSLNTKDIIKGNLSHSQNKLLNTFVKLNRSFKNNNPDFLLNTLDIGNHFKFNEFFKLLEEQGSGDRWDSFEVDDTIEEFLSGIEKAITQKKVAVKDGKILLRKFNELPVQFFTLDEVNLKTANKMQLGGKGMGLVEMRKMDLPVPEALIFPTDNCHAYLKNKKNWTAKLKQKMPEILNILGTPENPQLVSVRSGAPISMPGMMDTVLNVGFSEDNWDYFCQTLGKKVAENCYSKFMHLFCKSFLNTEIKPSKVLANEVSQFKKILKNNEIPFNSSGLFPLSQEEQIKYSLQAVFASWESKRAIAYRQHNGISSHLGTASIIQKMALGNLNNESCTGVLFSRDCINGNSGVIGEFLIKAQGEDVVSGTKTPLNISKMKDWNRPIYNQLVKISQDLERKTGDIQDIEFTVENGNLYILQHRKAVCSEQALVKFKIEQLKKKVINEDELIKSIPVSFITESKFIKSTTAARYNGLPANPGVIQGIVVRNEADIKKYAGKGTLIFYAKETTPEHAPLMLKTSAFLTEKGGFTSHAAILARSWNKPCIVNIGNANLKSGQKVSMDAGTGKVYLGDNKIVNDTKKTQKVKEIISKHYKLAQAIKQNNLEPFIQKINEQKAWMEKYEGVREINFKKEKNKKFIELVNKLTLFILQEKQNKFSEIKL